MPDYHYDAEETRVDGERIERVLSHPRQQSPHREIARDGGGEEARDHSCGGRQRRGAEGDVEPPASRRPSRMIGAASRNEKRAACSRSSPTPRPAAIVAPDREMPGMMAIPWAMPTRMADPQPSLSASWTRLALSASAAGERCCGDQEREAHPDQRRALEPVAAREPDEARRDRRHHDEPRKALVVRFLRVCREGGDDHCPELGPEVDDDRQERGDMQDGVEGQPELVGPSKGLLDQAEVT